jgi:hypothetical protein
MIAGSGSVFRTSLLYTISAFLLAGFFAVRNVSSWPARISYPGEESYEGCALAETVRLAERVPIYAAPSADGFAGATYGPLYFLAGSRLINPENPSYFPLRLLSAIAILGCAAGCALLAFWLTGSRLAAALSPLVFLSYGIVTYHGVSALSDNVALLFSFLGFLVAYRFRDSRAVLLAVPLMVFSFYYKPQFIAGPLAVFAYLLLERRFTRAAQFAGLMAAFLLGGFALFQWVVFRGQEFWQHFLLYQSTLFSWHQFELGFLAFAFIFAAPVLLGFEYLRLHPNRLLQCYFVAAVLMELMTIGKESAFIQYFYESILGISVLVPALLMSKIAARRGALEVLVLLGIAVLAGQWYTPPAPKPADVAQYGAVQNFLRRSVPPHSRVLGYRGGDLVQADLDTPFDDLFQTELLARHGVVADQYLIERIRERWFSAIILDFDLAKERNPLMLGMYLTAAARKAVEQNYQIAGQVAVPSPERLDPQDYFYVYVPRPQAATLASSAIPPDRMATGAIGISKQFDEGVRHRAFTN